MANAMESLFSGSYHPVKITEVKYLNKSLKQVRFKGDFSHIQKEFLPGNVIEFRINDTEFRHYTPSFFNKDEGIFEVLFYLHDKGPGSKWAANLDTGTELKLLGPGKKMSMNLDSKIHIIYGDETSLGLMKWFSNYCKDLQKACYFVIDIDEKHKDWFNFLSIDSSCFIEQNELENIEKDSTSFYLTGNAKKIQSFRNNILKMGFSKTQIQSYPYWAEGKIGL